MFLLSLAFVLFTISSVLIIKGISDNYLNRKSVGDASVLTEGKNGEKEVELSEYFEDYYSDDEVREDAFSRNDPFRDVCSQVDAEAGATVVYSNIVCFK